MNTFAKLASHTSKNAVTIVLADDHTMMREGTRKLLEEDPALVVVGEARNGTEALTLCHTLSPQVLILDIAMKGMNGFTVAQTLLTEPEQPTEILVLTAYGQAAYVQTMMRMGVKGYWLKSAGSNDIRRAVYDVAKRKTSLLQRRTTFLTLLGNPWHRWRTRELRCTCPTGARRCLSNDDQARAFLMLTCIAARYIQHVSLAPLSRLLLFEKSECVIAH